MVTRMVKLINRDTPGTGPIVSVGGIIKHLSSIVDIYRYNGLLVCIMFSYYAMFAQWNKINFSGLFTQKERERERDQPTFACCTSSKK